MPTSLFPTHWEGFRAEVKVGDDIRLVLTVVHTATGPMVGIYDAKTKKWWRDRPMVEDFDEGKAGRIHGSVVRHPRQPRATIFEFRLAGDRRSRFFDSVGLTRSTGAPLRVVRKLYDSKKHAKI